MTLSISSTSFNLQDSTQEAFVMEPANPLEDGETGSSEQRCNLVDVHLLTQEPHEPCVHLVCPSLVAVDWYHVLTHLNSTKGILDIKPSGHTQ